jgi:hypothetical protein
MSWKFITAGVGSRDFEAAADRLAASIAEFGVFDHIQTYKTADVLKYAPEITKWHSMNELDHLKGYGWYVWKSRFALQAVSQGFEDGDGIMYLDAGCEAFLSSFSKVRLKHYMNVAEETGACLFKIPTPERNYTKRLVVNRFSDVKSLDDFQFQSGSWLFTGALAKEFIAQWDAIVWEDQRFTDESISPDGEIDGFICNRYDQAVFSMLARSYSLNDCGDVPPGDIARRKPMLRLFVYPFAWARNRSGRSSVPTLMRIAGIFTVTLTNVFKKMQHKLTD